MSHRSSCQTKQLKQPDSHNARRTLRIGTHLAESRASQSWGPAGGGRWPSGVASPAGPRRAAYARGRCSHLGRGLGSSDMAWNRSRLTCARVSGISDPWAYSSWSAADLLKDLGGIAGERRVCGTVPLSWACGAARRRGGTIEPRPLWPRHADASGWGGPGRPAGVAFVGGAVSVAGRTGPDRVGSRTPSGSSPQRRSGTAARSGGPSRGRPNSRATRGHLDH